MNLLIALLVVSSSSTGGSLFSDELVPDQAAGGGLFSNEEIPDSSLATGDGLYSSVPGVPVFSPKVRTTIELRSETRLDTAFDRDGENILELSLGGKFSMDVDFSPTLSAYVVPKFEHQTAWTEDFDDRGFLFLNVPEAYLTWGKGRSYVRIGTQVFNWGTSDFAAPADVLNPMDLRKGLVAGTDPSANKIPVLAAEAVTGIGPITLRGVFQPFFTPSRFFLSGWDDSMGSIAAATGSGFMFPDLSGILGPATADHIGDQLLITKRPEDRPDSASVGARATLQLDSMDLSVTAVHGWESFPRIKFDPALALVGAQLLDSLASKKPIDPLAAALYLH